MLGEVSLRIQTINNKEALALEDMSTGAVNLLLSKMEFQLSTMSALAISSMFTFSKRLLSSSSRFTYSGSLTSKLRAILYELRAALARYKDLRNMVKQQGREEFYDKFDVERAHEMLGRPGRPG